MTGRAFGWESIEIDGIKLYEQDGLFDVGTPVEPDLDRRSSRWSGSGLGATSWATATIAWYSIAVAAVTPAALRDTWHRYTRRLC